MTIVINKTDGTVLTTIADGAVDTSTTNLALIGRLYRNYGELVNENFVKLLENFASNSSPSTPQVGQLWYDKANHILKVFRSTGFASLASASASSSAPGSPVTCDLWFDTVNAQLKFYDGTAWQVVAPGYTAAQTKSGLFVETVTDNTSAPHVVLKYYVQNTVIAIWSKDTSWIPQTSISGFTTIAPGLTLASDFSGKFHGTADNSTLFNTLNSTQMMRTDVNTSTTGTLAVLNDSGISIGANGNLTVSVSQPNVHYTVNGTGVVKTFMGSGNVLASILTATGQYQFLNGTAAAPVLSFQSEDDMSLVSDTGIYLSATNTLAIATGGANSVTISPTTITGQGNLIITGNITSGGRVTTPALIVSNDTTLGSAGDDNVFMNASTLAAPNSLTVTNGGGDYALLIESNDVQVKNDLIVNNIIPESGQLGVAGNIAAEGGFAASTSLTIGTSGHFGTNLTVVGNLIVGGTVIGGGGLLTVDSAGRLTFNSGIASGYNATGDISLGIDNYIRARNTSKFWAIFDGTIGGLAIYDSQHIDTITRVTSQHWTFGFETPITLASSFQAIAGPYNIRIANVSAAPNEGDTSINITADTETSFMSIIMFAG
jgi:hypothetical protein